MSKKGKVKGFFDFEVLMTERVLKWLYVSLSVIWIFWSFYKMITSWISAISMMVSNYSYQVWTIIQQLVLVPLGTFIGLFIGLILIRVAAEALFVIFETNRSLKKEQDKDQEDA